MMLCLVAAMLRNYCAEKRSMRTKLAVFDNPVTSHKNFVLMWETDTSGQVSGDVDDNIMELAKVGSNDFQLNVKENLLTLEVIMMDLKLALMVSLAQPAIKLSPITLVRWKVTPVTS